MGLFSTISNLFRKTPKGPAVASRGDPSKAGFSAAQARAWLRASKGVRKGHRGMALGTSEAGKGNTSKANREKWKYTTDAFVEGFLLDADLFPVHSTNVAIAQYHHETNQLMLEFLNGAAYLYSNVTIDEAFDFARAPSKGIWVWNNLRVRGSKTGYKKPYVRLRGGTILPKLREDITDVGDADVIEDDTFDVGESDVLQEEAEMLGDMIPTATTNTSSNAPTWEYRGEMVRANTKGEARSYFNRTMGQLGAGAVIRKVVR